MTDEITQGEYYVVPALTREEDSFALAIIEYSGNVGLAYKAAFGPDADMPNARGRELLNRPAVALRIKEIQDKLQDNSLISTSAHLQEMAEIRDLAKGTGQLKTAFQAERARGEVAGFYQKVTNPESATNAAIINSTQRLEIMGDRLVKLLHQKQRPQNTDVVDVQSR